MSQEQIEYISHGSCLVIGQEDSVKRALNDHHWPREIRPRALIVDVQGEEAQNTKRMKQGPIVRKRPGLKGHLGQFNCLLRADEGERDAINLQRATFDLVLDLLDPPLLTMEIPPLGYFSLSSASIDLSSLIDSLRDWVGVFEKPKYFSYQEDICAHGPQNVRGCQACLDVCSAEAIVSQGHRISVDPYLCQGCGDCTNVCPTGALSYQSPTREQILNQLMHGLRDGRKKIVIIHADSVDPKQIGTAEELLIEVESVAACGPEIWLAALCYGGKVVRLHRDGLTKKSIKNVEHQMFWVNRLLEGLGVGVNPIGWFEGSKEEPTKTGRVNETESADFAAMADKRDVLRMALDHLCGNTERTSQQVVELPLGVPMGGLIIDQNQCTACMACVGICPTKALAPGEQQPRLKFMEINCVQCGLCENVCPENAIKMNPRLLTDRKAVREQQILYEETPFPCIECGKVFASRRIIESILSKVSRNAMFSDHGHKRRLLMCENCRVQDMLKHEN